MYFSNTNHPPTRAQTMNYGSSITGYLMVCQEFAVGYAMPVSRSCGSIL